MYVAYIIFFVDDGVLGQRTDTLSRKQLVKRNEDNFLNCLLHALCRALFLLSQLRFNARH